MSRRIIRRLGACLVAYVVCTPFAHAAERLLQWNLYMEAGFQAPNSEAQGREGIPIDFPDQYGRFRSSADDNTSFSDTAFRQPNEKFLPDTLSISTPAYSETCEYETVTQEKDASKITILFKTFPHPPRGDHKTHCSVTWHLSVVAVTD